MGTAADNKALIERFWQDLYDGDYDKAGSYFTEDGHYRDVPAPDEGARGPSQIADRLRLGLEPIERHVHRLLNIVADGDIVVTEHAEEWHWHTGESVTLPFVSVHEVHDGRITRWWDYWDLQTLLGGAPQWWLEHIAQGYM